jgi:hypothetical protein
MRRDFLWERLRYVSAREIPYRLRQQWVRATDPLRRPPATAPGPDPRWPWPDPARPIAPLPTDDWPPDEPVLGGTRDPRDAWEITRLQTATVEDARAWLAANPPGRGIGWANAMEVALRLVSLVRIGADRAAVHAHADWVLRHPSLDSSANNHRVAELGALALAATALPDLPDARRWRAEAADLARVLRDQLHPDGVGVEQSVHYLAYDLEWARLADRCGVEDLREPIARAERFLASVTDATGQRPALGDDDGGRVLAGQVDPVGAGTESRCFRDGGLTALRSDGLLVLVDHGPLGGATLAAHGHADALAVYVHDEHGPVVVGRGTGRYQPDVAVRRFHRGTSAHPTVVVDGADQSEALDHPFLWGRRAEARLERVDLEEGRVVAAHDGYRGRAVVHRREVRVRGREIELLDTLDGERLHHVAVHLPLAPDLRVDEALRVWRGDRPVADVIFDAPLAPKVVRGGPRPGLGWHSPAYGRWVPAEAIAGSAVVAAPATVRTRIRLGYTRPR